MPVPAGFCEKYTIHQQNFSGMAKIKALKRGAFASGIPNVL
jgi:hypothetical protein